METEVYFMIDLKIRRIWSNYTKQFITQILKRRSIVWKIYLHQVELSFQWSRSLLIFFHYAGRNWLSRLLIRDPRKRCTMEDAVNDEVSTCFFLKNREIPSSFSHKAKQWLVVQRDEEDWSTRSCSIHLSFTFQHIKSFCSPIISN